MIFVSAHFTASSRVGAPGVLLFPPVNPQLFAGAELAVDIEPDVSTTSKKYGLTPRFWAGAGPAIRSGKSAKATASSGRTKVSFRVFARTRRKIRFLQRAALGAA
jgi:hypothetical protein